VLRPVAEPYVKDYDARPEDRPAAWPSRFDMARWRLFAAHGGGGVRVGEAAVAFDTPGLHLLDGRRDVAALWDLRIAPSARGTGVGAALFAAAQAWAAARGCRQMVVETQNVNVPACRFYRRQGCVLGAIHRFAYPTLPDEAQLLWYRDLSR
jgi:GNAT superfamily N-acetyltransferase